VVKAQAKFLALHDTARREGFENDLRPVPSPVFMMNAEGLNGFELALDRQRDAEASRAPPLPIPPKFAMVVNLNATATAKPQAAPAKAAPAAKPRAPIVETPAKGEFAVIVLREGLEAKGRQ
jgi:hypothetical protein